MNELSILIQFKKNSQSNYIMTDPTTIEIKNTACRSFYLQIRDLLLYTIKIWTNHGHYISKGLTPVKLNDVSR